MTRIQATGLTTVTSGNAQIIGVVGNASVTAGTWQIFAGVTSSVSITPVMSLLTTGTFQRFPANVSGAGFTVNYINTLDPNLMIFWSPA